jgi:hypothetical protein
VVCNTIRIEQGACRHTLLPSAIRICTGHSHAPSVQYKKAPFVGMLLTYINSPEYRLDLSDLTLTSIPTPSHPQTLYSMKRSLHNTSYPIAKRKKSTSDAATATLCSPCQRIDFQKILDLSSEDLQCAGQEGYLLGTRFDGFVASCALCQLCRTMIDDPNTVVQAVQLRAYSAFGNTRKTSFGILPPKLKLKDVPHLGIITRNFAAQPHSIVGKKRSFCMRTSKKHNGIVLPRIPSAKIDYTVITAWLECCRTLHQSSCKQKNNTTRPLRLIDCNTFPPSLVLAPQSGPYLALSYTWGGPYDYSTSSTDGVISHPPKTISDAITVTRELGFRFLWVDGYCIDQAGSEEKQAQIDIMNKIYGGAELTIVAAAGSHNDNGLPGVSNDRKAERSKEPEASICLGDIQIVCIDESPRKSIQCGTWATRAWTYQEAILSQRLLYFTEREIYFECHSMQSREAIHADLRALHCKQGKLYAQLNSGLFLGKTSCPNSYIRAPHKFLMRSYELLRQYTAREMRCEEDSLRAAAGVLKYLEEGKVPVYHLAGVPVLFGAESVEEAHRSLLVSLLWVHQKTFPPREEFPLPHPTRRYNLPSWSWAGWKGDVNFIISPVLGRDLRYVKFEPHAKITQITTEDHLHYDLYTFFNNTGEAKQAIPHALTMTARILCPESFAISFAYRKPVCRVTSTLNPPGKHPDWDPTLPAYKSQRGRRRPPRYYPGSEGKLYIYRGPSVYTNLPRFFDANRFQVVLMGTCPKVSGQRTSGAVYFLIVEPQGTVFSRVGVLEIKETLEVFSKDLRFEEHSITIV